MEGANGTVGAGGRGRPPGEKTKQGNNQWECLHEKLQLKSPPCTKQVSLRDVGMRHTNGAGNGQEQDLSLVDYGSGFGHFRVFFFFLPLSGAPAAPLRLEGLQPPGLSAGWGLPRAGVCPPGSFLARFLPDGLKPCFTWEAQLPKRTCGLPPPAWTA